MDTKKHSPRFLGNPIQAQKTIVKNLLHEENKSADEHAPYHGMSNSCLSISRDAPEIVSRKEGCELQCWGTMWKIQWKMTWKLRLCKVDVAFLVVNTVVPKQEYILLLVVVFQESITLLGSTAQESAIHLEWATHLIA